MSLPGHTIRLKPDVLADCDDHPDRQAGFRVQGETDSFGCEYHYMCHECYAEYKSNTANEWDNWECDHCSNIGVRPIRDPDEGSHGPVYYLCKSCRDKLNAYHSEAA